MTAIGQPKPLLEGRSKVLGALRYCPDLDRPGMLHARLVTSPYAHARLLRVDVTEAEKIEGVVRVLTAADLPDIPPLNRPALLLARERVLFVGQPVALVLATHEAIAQDAADAVFADYEPLPAVTDLDQALEPDAPAVWPEGLPGRSEEAAAHGADSDAGEAASAQESKNIANRVAFDRGAVDQALADADVVVDKLYRSAGVHQSYIEPHATLVEPHADDGGVTVWTSTQATFYVRDALARFLGVPGEQVRVFGTPTGGAFGGKFVLYEPLLAYACRLIKRPVRLVLTRLEEMLAANPAPPTRIRIRLGATRDGKLTALDAELVMDTGCFPSSMAGLVGILLGSFYRIPNQRVSGVEVLTHRASTGAYRAPLSPQAAFALETALDELAARLEIDPIELRMKNASKPGDPMATERPWPSMGMGEVLEALRQHPAWQERQQAREKGRGIGIALGGWPGGTEPASAACSLESDGSLRVHVGSADITGSHTTLAMLAADAFGVEAERISLVSSDTLTAPFAGSSGGSKIVYTMGPVVMEAAREARAQTLELAAATFEADPADLEITGGKVQVKGAPDKAIPLYKIAQRTMRYGSRQAPVYAHGRSAQPGPSPAFCAQLAEVSVDPDSGAVTLHRLVVLQDVGKSLNPLLIDGQMAGGALQGMGWALLEQMLYDDQGQLLTATLADYALPHASQIPDTLDCVQIEVPSELGPLGARGVGEPPVIATAAAVANAIADATGARADQLPMTPERLLKALGRAAAS